MSTFPHLPYRGLLTGTSPSHWSSSFTSRQVRGRLFSSRRGRRTCCHALTVCAWKWCPWCPRYTGTTVYSDSVRCTWPLWCTHVSILTSGSKTASLIFSSGSLTWILSRVKLHYVAWASSGSPRRPPRLARALLQRRRHMVRPYNCLSLFERLKAASIFATPYQCWELKKAIIVAAQVLEVQCGGTNTKVHSFPTANPRQAAPARRPIGLLKAARNKVLGWSTNLAISSCYMFFPAFALQKWRNYYPHFVVFTKHCTG